MKVLVLSHISELLGGAERSILEVLDIWERKYGVKPEFILREPLGTYVTELEKRKWKFHSLPYTFWSDSRPPTEPYRIFQASLTNTQAIFEIEKIIQKVKPDLVLTNSVVCPWAAFAAHFQKVPHIWFVREYGDLDHGRIFEMGRQQTLEDVGNLSELVLTNSMTLGDHLRQYISKHKVTTLYHPFDLESLRARTQESVSNPYKGKDSLKLVITGSVTASKGHKDVIIAVGELNKQGHNTELCVIGGTHETEFMAELEAIISKMDIAGKIHFVGTQKNPFPLIAQADVGLMTSRREAFGRVTFEYLAVGKPVVGANSGATPEMVESGRNGYLYKQGDSQDLMRQLKKYVQNKKLISRHGAASAKKAEAMMKSELNIDAVFARVEKVVREGVTLPPPINYSHRWLEYPSLAQEYLTSSQQVSVKKLLYMRLRERVKRAYFPLRRVYARILKK